MEASSSEAKVIIHSLGNSGVPSLPEECPQCNYFYVNYSYSTNKLIKNYHSNDDCTGVTQYQRLSPSQEPYVLTALKPGLVDHFTAYKSVQLQPNTYYEILSLNGETEYLRIANDDPDHYRCFKYADYGADAFLDPNEEPLLPAAFKT